MRWGWELVEKIAKSCGFESWFPAQVAALAVLASITRPGLRLFECRDVTGREGWFFILLFPLIKKGSQRAYSATFSFLVEGIACFALRSLKSCGSFVHVKT